MLYTFVLNETNRYNQFVDAIELGKGGIWEPYSLSFFLKDYILKIVYVKFPKAIRFNEDIVKQYPVTIDKTNQLQNVETINTETTLLPIPETVVIETPRADSPAPVEETVSDTPVPNEIPSTKSPIPSETPSQKVPGKRGLKRLTELDPAVLERREIEKQKRREERNSQKPPGGGSGRSRSGRGRNSSKTDE